MTSRYCEELIFFCNNRLNNIVVSLGNWIDLNLCEYGGRDGKCSVLVGYGGGGGKGLGLVGYGGGGGKGSFFIGGSKNSGLFGYGGGGDEGSGLLLCAGGGYENWVIDESHSHLNGCPIFS